MRDDPTLTLAAFGAFLALGLAYLLVLSWGYATVARLWLSGAWERHQERRREYLMDRALAEAAASFPGGSYAEEGGR